MTDSRPATDPSTITYLYFGTDWDPENRTSSHHIARWLAERSRVMYFECPGMRAPKSTGRDLRRLARKVVAAFAPARRPSPSVEVRTLLQLPLHRVPGIKAFNRWILLLAARRVARRARKGGGPVVSWFVVPHVGGLAARLGEDLVVHYCVDDHSSFPHVDSAAIASMDEELSRRADIVFVTSDTLMPRKQTLARQVVVSPHGVNVDHFRRAVDANETIPDDIVPLSGVVIGFFGLIETWINLDIVDALARRHPEWTFLMIGRIAVPPSTLPISDNIRFLGARPYDSLPRYGRRFDVSIIPYHPTRQVYHANPIKLREYLAMEKPIVAVSTPEIDKFADLVRIATTVDEWEQAILDALANDAEADRSARRAAADLMTWNARLGRVQQIVIDALDGRPFDPPSVSR